jgi:hypothetical protein
MNRKQKRESKRRMSKEDKQINEAVERAVADMPKSCTSCSKDFDNKDQQSLNTWRIAVYDDGPIHLFCPDCKSDE